MYNSILTSIYHQRLPLKKEQGMENRLEKWHLQVELFKKTSEYQQYREQFTDADRRRLKMPFTPRIVRKTHKRWSPANPVVSVENVSKRAFDGIIKTWKKHVYDIMLYVPEQYSFSEGHISNWSDIRCGHCGLRGYYKCPCWCVAYCSAACQTRDWPSHKRLHGQL